MASNKRSLKAYVRYDGNGRIIPGSLILNRFKPAVGNWQETPAHECCNYTPPLFNLELFRSRMSSCYQSVTNLIPNIFYFSDSNDDNVSNTYIQDGCNDMWDNGNAFNTNLTQLYDNIVEDSVDFSLSIPYTHTQQITEDCPYVDPPIDGSINDGTDYFGEGSTYFTNMYPGMFIIAATGVNVSEFSITGDLGSDGDGTNEAFVATVRPGWKAFIKTNYGDDPSVNHIILINGNVSGATQLYNDTREFDDHCVQGLGPQNNTIITAVVATTKESSSGLTEEEAVAIANEMLNVYDSGCK